MDCFTVLHFWRAFPHHHRLHHDQINSLLTSHLGCAGTKYKKAHPKKFTRQWNIHHLMNMYFPSENGGFSNDYVGFQRCNFPFIHQTQTIQTQKGSSRGPGRHHSKNRPSQTSNWKKRQDNEVNVQESTIPWRASWALSIPTFCTGDLPVFRWVVEWSGRCCHPTVGYCRYIEGGCFWNLVKHGDKLPTSTADRRISEPATVWI